MEVMRQTLTDKAISKISKGMINTVRMKREEMVDMIDRHFIQKAVTPEDYQAIWKVVKRGILLDKLLDSKDGDYQLRSESSQWGRNLHRYIWIYDRKENIYYEYNYYIGFYGKFKRTLRNRLKQAQNDQ